MEKHRQSLATAHVVLMFLAFAGLANLVYAWCTHAPPQGLSSPAMCLQTAVLLYLVSTAVLAWNIARTARSGLRAEAALGLPALLGHLWVLLVAGFTAWRGPLARTLLGGFYGQLATLLTISLLALLLLMPTRCLAGEADAANDRQLRGLAWLHGAICLGVVFALWYLETQPLDMAK